MVDGRPDGRRAGPPTRRRGTELEAAILEAAWAELTEAGYDALTMEGVAERAKTSRAVLYRRWPSRPELVVAALRHHTDFGTPESFDTGALRGDMLALLRHMSSRVGEIAGVLSFLLSASFDEAGISPAELRARAVGDDPSAVDEMLRRAAARGEIGPGAVTQRIGAVAVDLVRHDLIMKQSPIPDADLVEIVDDIFLPLVRAAAGATGPARAAARPGGNQHQPRAFGLASGQLGGKRPVGRGDSGAPEPERAGQPVYSIPVIGLSGSADRETD